MNTRRRLLLSALVVLGGCATIAPPLALSEAEQESVREAQAYLDGLTTFQASFTQSGSFGGGNGVLWVARPGRLRLTYFGPNSQDMVANDGLFVIYDGSTGATTTVPVSRTPLGLLLGAHVALSRTVGVTAFAEDTSGLSLTLQDSAHPQQGTLSVVLRKNPLLLVGVTATDVRGRSLVMQLANLNLHPIVTPALFAPPGPASTR